MKTNTKWIVAAIALMVGLAFIKPAVADPLVTNATITTFDNFTSDALYPSWSSGTITSTPTSYVIAATGYGSNYKYIGFPAINGTGCTNIELDVYLSGPPAADGQLGPIVRLIDGDGTEYMYAWYGQTLGHHILNMPINLPTATNVAGTTPGLDLTTLTHMHMALDPGGFGVSGSYTSSWNNLRLTGGLIDQCANNVSSFINFSLDARYASWASATIVTNTQGYQVAASGFGSGYKALSSSIDASANTNIELTVTLSGPAGANGQLGPIVRLVDGDGTAMDYAWYGQALGTHVLTKALSAGVQTAAGSVPGFNFSTVSGYMLLLDPGSFAGTYTVAWEDLDLTGCSLRITGQPVGQSVSVGGSATFAVGAVGESPLAYKWYLGATALADGGVISGSTSASLSISSVSYAHVGSYTVVVSNSYGSVTSSPAVLAINCPAHNISVFTNFNVDALFGSWQSATIVNNLGDYQVTASGFGSGYKALSSSVSALGSSNLELTVTLSGPPAADGQLGPIVRLVDGDGTAIDYAWYGQMLGTHVLTKALSAGVQTQAGSVPGFDFSYVSGFMLLLDPGSFAGTYTVAWQGLDLTGCGIFITGQPVSQSVPSGSSANFTVGATSDAPLSYQWYLGATPLMNGGDISGSTTATLTISNVSIADVGNYSVVLSNSIVSGSSGVATLTPTCPAITVSAVALPFGSNTVAYSGSLGASGGVGPYSYTLGGGSLPANIILQSNGTLSGVPSAVVGSYNFTAIATDSNGCTGTNSFVLKLLPAKGDSAVPTVKIMNRKNGEVVTNAPLSLSGTAKDVVLLTAVHYWLDDTTNNPATGDAVGTTSWTINLPGASQGAHTVIVQAEDLAGNKSKLASVLLHYGTNSFTDLAGEYNGLFNTNNGLTGDFRHVDSGLFQVKVKVKAGKLPTFTGSMSVDGNKLGFAGTFEMTGVGTVNKTKSNPDGIIDRQSKYFKTNLAMTLQLPFDGSGTISGTVAPTNGEWVSTMAGYLAAGPEDTNYTCNYTMVIPGNPLNSAAEPGGSGYGVVVITNGVIKVAGSKLGDGQAFGQKVSVSEGGLWPLYSAANKDANKVYQSAIMGWVTVSNKAAAGLSGTLTWDKHADLSVAYPAGFTSVVALAASPYFTGDPGAMMILPYTVGVLSNALLTVEGGGSLGLINSVTLTNAGGKNKFIVTTTKSEKMTLSVTPKTGKLSISFTDTNTPLPKVSGAGVVLTNTATGHGYFMVPKTGTQSGAFTLEGN